MNKEFLQTELDFTPLISSSQIFALTLLCLAFIVFFIIFRKKSPAAARHCSMRINGNAA